MTDEHLSDLRKLELDTLYKEIADNSTRIYAVFSICVTATTAAVGIFTKPVLEINTQPIPGDLTPFAVLLLPGMIILPCMLLITSLLHSTVRIAGYIAVFFEQAEGAQWQSRIQRLREFRQPRYFAFGMRSIFSGLALVSLAGSLLALVRLWGLALTPLHYWYAAALGGLVLIFLRQTRKLRKVWSTEKFSEYQRAWQSLGTWEKDGFPKRPLPDDLKPPLVKRLQLWWSADS